MNELFIVVNEIDNHAVAVKGNGVFAITYSLVANVRSLIFYEKT